MTLTLDLCVLRRYLSILVGYGYHTSWPPQEKLFIWSLFFQYNKRLLRQKMGGACLYMPQDGHWLAGLTNTADLDFPVYYVLYCICIYFVFIFVFFPRAPPQEDWRLINGLCHASRHGLRHTGRRRRRASPWRLRC